MASESSSIEIAFLTHPTPEQYAPAVLACQYALTLVGLSASTTVWPDGTATDAQINQVSDRWLASSPWSD